MTGPVCAPSVHRSNQTAKFCSECGAPTHAGTQSAEYKQATVLFADVVHSMDIAAAVGAERLREIMAAWSIARVRFVRHVVCQAVVAMLHKWNASGTTTFEPVWT